MCMYAHMYVWLSNLILPVCTGNPNSIWYELLKMLEEKNAWGRVYILNITTLNNEYCFC
jgi:hypothetical protein